MRLVNDAWKEALRVHARKTLARVYFCEQCRLKEKFRDGASKKIASARNCEMSNTRYISRASVRIALKHVRVMHFMFIRVYRSRRDAINFPLTIPRVRVRRNSSGPHRINYAKQRSLKKKKARESTGWATYPRYISSKS